MSQLNRARREILDLPPLSPLDYLRRTRHPITPVIHGFSSSITRTPSDFAPGVYVTGYWFLDHLPTWQPPSDLLCFLESGPPPVYVGFGSNLVGSNPEALTRLIINALQRTGQRGILLDGWSGLGDINLPDTVFKVDDVPFDWLFPRMAGVVCHGGAGTTSTALRAGMPPVMIPFFGDQHFWARRVYAMGLGPRPVPRHILTEDKLVAAISQSLNDKELKSRAVRMGRKLASERGVEKAVEIINVSCQ